MALLSGMMRTVAVTGSTESVDAWFVDRQQGRWAQQTYRAALGAPAPEAPRAAAPPSSAETLGRLTSLRERGLITDDELARLRAREGV